MLSIAFIKIVEYCFVLIYEVSETLINFSLKVSYIFSSKDNSLIVVYVRLLETFLDILIHMVYIVNYNFYVAILNLYVHLSFTQKKKCIDMICKVFQESN